MSEHKFKPGDKVRFRADVPEADRNSIDPGNRIRAIDDGETMEIADHELSEQFRAHFVVVAWSGFQFVSRKSYLEPVEPAGDIKKCTCDIGTLIAAGCKCGGR